MRVVTNEILKANMPFIYNECKKVSNPSSRYWEDIKQEGMIAFCKAYIAFDEDKNKNRDKGFYSYASKYIRLALLHYIDTSCTKMHYSQKIREAVYEINRAVKQGKDINEVFAKLKFTDLDKSEYFAYMLERGNKDVSLDDVIYKGKDDTKEYCLYTFLKDDSSNVEEIIGSNLFIEEFRVFIRKFEEYMKLELYIEEAKFKVAQILLNSIIEEEEVSQKELAESYGLSVSMVSRIRKRMLEELQKKLVEDGLVKI